MRHTSVFSHCRGWQRLIRFCVCDSFFIALFLSLSNDNDKMPCVWMKLVLARGRSEVNRFALYSYLFMPLCDVRVFLDRRHFFLFSALYYSVGLFCCCCCVYSDDMSPTHTARMRVRFIHIVHRKWPLQSLLVNQEFNLKLMSLHDASNLRVFTMCRPLEPAIHTDTLSDCMAGHRGHKSHDAP